MPPLTLDDLEKLFTIVAISVGGVWVYYNYFRGRTYKPRLEPAVSGRSINKGANSYLVVGAKLKNAGLSKIGITREGTGVRVLAYSSDKRAVSVELMNGKWLATLPVFEEDVWVEPGKGIEDQLLVTIPENNYSALRVELWVVSGGIECQSVAVVEQSADEGVTSCRRS
jgi:hypothetical protein